MGLFAFLLLIHSTDEDTTDFKSGLVGFHLSDHQLQPEHEVEALAEVVSDFAAAVDDAKALKGKESRHKKEQ